jgi:tryptophan synthase beta chain
VINHAASPTKRLRRAFSPGKHLETFAAAVQFSRPEGIISAPVSSHVKSVAINKALRCKVSGEKNVLAFNLSGHGHFDMAAYEAYHRGQIEDNEHPVEAVDAMMAHLP